MSNLRSTIDQFLTLLGVVIVVVPVTLISESLLPTFIVLVGMAVSALGVWRLGSSLLPDRRIYVGLRSEVEHFIQLVRQLNSYALEAESTGLESIRSEMHASIDRMVALAGDRSAAPRDADGGNAAGE